MSTSPLYWILGLQNSRLGETPPPLNGSLHLVNSFSHFQPGNSKINSGFKVCVKVQSLPSFSMNSFASNLDRKMKPLPAVFSRCLPPNVFMPLCMSSTCVSAYTFTCLPPRESTLPTLQNEYLSVCSSHLLSSDLFHELFCLFRASLILLSYLAFPYVNKWLMSLPLAREKLNPLTLCIINSPHPSPIPFALSEPSLGCATLTSRFWLYVCVYVYPSNGRY